MAILMGAAEVLAGMKDELQGTVKFTPSNRRRRAFSRWEEGGA